MSGKEAITLRNPSASSSCNGCCILNQLSLNVFGSSRAQVLPAEVSKPETAIVIGSSSPQLAKLNANDLSDESDNKYLIGSRWSGVSDSVTSIADSFCKRPRNGNERRSH